jgi:hypothetical protein
MNKVFRAPTGGAGGTSPGKSFLSTLLDGGYGYEELRGGGGGFNAKLFDITNPKMPYICHGYPLSNRPRGVGNLLTHGRAARPPIWRPDAQPFKPTLRVGES